MSATVLDVYLVPDPDEHRARRRPGLQPQRRARVLDRSRPGDDGRAGTLHTPSCSDWTALSGPTRIAPAAPRSSSTTPTTESAHPPSLRSIVAMEPTSTRTARLRAAGAPLRPVGRRRPRRRTSRSGACAPHRGRPSDVRRTRSISRANASSTWPPSRSRSATRVWASTSSGLSARQPRCRGSTERRPLEERGPGQTQAWPPRRLVARSAASYSAIAVSRSPAHQRLLGRGCADGPRPPRRPRPPRLRGRRTGGGHPATPLAAAACRTCSSRLASRPRAAGPGRGPAGRAARRPRGAPAGCPAPGPARAASRRRHGRPRSARRTRRPACDSVVVDLDRRRDCVRPEADHTTTGIDRSTTSVRSDCSPTTSSEYEPPGAAAAAGAPGHAGRRGRPRRDGRTAEPSCAHPRKSCAGGQRPAGT